MLACAERESQQQAALAQFQDVLIKSQETQAKVAKAQENHQRLETEILGLLAQQPVLKQQLNESKAICESMNGQLQFQEQNIAELEGKRHHLADAETRLTAVVSLVETPDRIQAAIDEMQLARKRLDKLIIDAEQEFHDAQSIAKQNRGEPTGIAFALNKFHRIIARVG